MAYDKVKLYNQALNIIKDKELFFIEDIVTLLPCHKTTFYDYFPINSNENNTIKDALENNRIGKKVKMRSKWYKSDNATLQMGLMKLIGTEEEAHRLNGSSQKLNVKADVLNYTDEEREKRIKELLKKNAE